MVKIFTGTLEVEIPFNDTELTDVVELIFGVVVVGVPFTAYIELLIKPALKQIYP